MMHGTGKNAKQSTILRDFAKRVSTEAEHSKTNGTLASYWEACASTAVTRKFNKLIDLIKATAWENPFGFLDKDFRSRY